MSTYTKPHPSPPRTAGISSHVERASWRHRAVPVDRNCRPGWVQRKDAPRSVFLGVRRPVPSSELDAKPPACLGSGTVPWRHRSRGAMNPDPFGWHGKNRTLLAAEPQGSEGRTRNSQRLQICCKSSLCSPQESAAFRPEVGWDRSSLRQVGAQGIEGTARCLGRRLRGLICGHIVLRGTGGGDSNSGSSGGGRFQLQQVGTIGEVDRNVEFM